MPLSLSCLSSSFSPLWFSMTALLGAGADLGCRLLLFITLNTVCQPCLVCKGSVKEISWLSHGGAPVVTCATFKILSFYVTFGTLIRTVLVWASLSSLRFGLCTSCICMSISFAKSWKFSVTISSEGFQSLVLFLLLLVPLWRKCCYTRCCPRGPLN